MTELAPPKPIATDKPDPMPLRNFRCDDELWKAAQARAAAEGLDMSKVIRHYLHAYVAS